MTGVPELVGAFGAGVGTFFAPCSFPLLPGYIAYYVGAVEAEKPIGGALIRALAGSLGIFAVVAGLGVVATTVGRGLLQYLVYAEPLVGVLVIALGLVLLSGYSFQFHVELPERTTSVVGFGVFGAGYAFAALGCFAPLFIAVVLEGATASMADSILLLVTFGLGMAILFVATTLTVAVGRSAVMSSLPVSPKTVTRVAGIVLVVAGLVQLEYAFRLL